MICIYSSFIPVSFNINIKNPHSWNLGNYCDPKKRKNTNMNIKTSYCHPPPRYGIVPHFDSFLALALQFLYWVFF